MCVWRWPNFFVLKQVDDILALAGFMTGISPTAISAPIVISLLEPRVDYVVAAISNFTQWLAVHIAQEYSPEIRVNALAPGFFLTEQNRFLLTDAQTRELTPRGQKINDHTPQGKFGTPEYLLGAMFWLLSPASKFVTGVVVQVDGGFSAFSGV